MKFFQRILVLLIISNIFISKTQATCLGNSTQSTCQSSSPSITDTTNNNTCTPWTGLTNTPVENYTDICVFNTSNSSCCVNVGCVPNAHYTSSGGGCVCDNKYHYVSASNTCDACQDCGVTAGTAVTSTVNNNCYYTISCNKGYEIKPENDHCSSSLYAICTGATYGITLNDSANGGSGGMGIVREVYGTKWIDASNNEITNVTIPVKTSNIFTGYYSGGNEIKIPANGLLPGNTTFSNSTTLYAYFDPCPTMSGTNGTVYQIVSNNTCGGGGYYIVCNPGFQNTSYFDASHPSSTSSPLSCTTCSAGYYCPGGTRVACPTHMTSNAGSTALANCFAAAGYYYSSSVLHNCPIGMTSNAGAVSSNNCFYTSGASGTKFCDANGCLHLPINVGY